MMKKALILISILAVGGAAAAGYYVGKDDRSAEQIAEDAGITAEVKSLLLAEPGIRSLDISVDTYNQVVTLKGKVQTGEQRGEAARVARKAKGVKTVTNELKAR